ncbi:hypothetical protein ACFX2I_022769 [Malus domestica]
MTTISKGHERLAKVKRFKEDLLSCSRRFEHRPHDLDLDSIMKSFEEAQSRQTSSSSLHPNPTYYTWCAHPEQMDLQASRTTSFFLAASGFFGSFQETSVEREVSSEEDTWVSSGSTSTASGVANGVSGMQSELLSSKYLKTMQELLDEVVNVGNGMKTELPMKGHESHRNLLLIISDKQDSSLIQAKNTMRAAQNKAFTAAGSIPSRSWSLRNSPLKKALEDREGYQFPFESPLSLVAAVELQTPQQRCPAMSFSLPQRHEQLRLLESSRKLAVTRKAG